MKQSRWESPVCILCDYWWTILLLLAILIVLLLTANYWLPFIGIPAAPASPLANPTPDITLTQTLPTQVPTEAWKTFSDPELKYLIQYPAQWIAAVPAIRQENGVTKSVLITDTTGSTEQTRSDQETVRLSISSFPKNNRDLKTWVMNDWNWISGGISQLNVGKYQALQAQFAMSDDPSFKQIIVWVDRPADFLVLWGQMKVEPAQNDSSLKKMLQSIVFIQ